MGHKQDIFVFDGWKRPKRERAYASEDAAHLRWFRDPAWLVQIEDFKPNYSQPKFYSGLKGITEGSSTRVGAWDSKLTYQPYAPLPKGIWRVYSSQKDLIRIPYAGLAREFARGRPTTERIDDLTTRFGPSGRFLYQGPIRDRTSSGQNMQGLNQLEVFHAIAEPYCRWVDLIVRLRWMLSLVDAISLPVGNFQQAQSLEELIDFTARQSVRSSRSEAGGSDGRLSVRHGINVARCPESLEFNVPAIELQSIYSYHDVGDGHMTPASRVAYANAVLNELLNEQLALGTKSSLLQGDHAPFFYPMANDLVGAIFLSLAMELVPGSAKDSCFAMQPVKYCPRCNYPYVGRSDKKSCGDEACRKWVYRKKQAC